jgi:hypothetical protein
MSSEEVRGQGLRMRSNTFTSVRIKDIVTLAPDPRLSATLSQLAGHVFKTPSSVIGVSRIFAGIFRFRKRRMMLRNLTRFSDKNRVAKRTHSCYDVSVATTQQEGSGASKIYHYDNPHARER